MGVFRREPEYTTPPAIKYSAPRPITAAASRLKLSDKGEAEQFKARRSSATALWQAEAWEYYDAIAEIKYAFNLVASVVSRIRIYAAVVEEDGETPVPIRNTDVADKRIAEAAVRAVDALDSAYGGQPGLLRDAALNLSVAGECFLVQVPARHVDGQLVPESWDIRSVDELQVVGTGNNARYVITPRRDLISGGTMKKGVIELPERAFVGRVWRAHPRFSEEPDSSLKGLLDLCAELLLLNRTFRATERSRLNAGALYIPDGLSMASGPDPDAPFDEDGNPLDQTVEEAEDEFEDQLLDAMITPIEDESSAAAVAPLIIRGPAELGDKIKQFKFERSFDASLIQRADRVLERILQGLDVPKDTVTGLANVKYSNAIQIDESLYKAHIEPMLLLICDAITMIYLRPYLRGNGFSESEVNRVTLWYDASAVATRSDRAADADSGFDKLAVSYDAWRRAHGFADSDAPSPTELVLRLVSQQPSLSPELTEAILTTIAPEIMGAARAAGQANSVAPVPPEVQNIIQGGPPAPTNPVTATSPANQQPPAEPGAEGGEPAAPEAAAPDTPVAPDQDAPPVPLEEPGDA